tara:strand:+ start:5561 stop:5698 length:138 start_codon:yes stop_codon:yes gene_type:complete
LLRAQRSDEEEDADAIEISAQPQPWISAIKTEKTNKIDKKICFDK